MTVHHMTDAQWRDVVAQMRHENLDSHNLWRSYVEPVHAPNGCVAVTTRDPRYTLGTGMIFVMVVARAMSHDDAEAMEWFRYLADNVKVRSGFQEWRQGTTYYLPWVRVERS